MKKKTWVEGRARTVILTRVEMPIPGRWTFEVKEDGSFFVTSETNSSITLEYDLTRYTLKPREE